MAIGRRLFAPSRAIATGVALVLFACGPDPAAPPDAEPAPPAASRASLTLDEELIRLGWIYEIATVRAEATDSAGGTLSADRLTWTSRNDSVARVAAPARIEAWRRGETWVVARWNEVRDSVRVVVEADAVHLDVSPDATSMIAGGVLELQRELEDPSGAPVFPPHWSTNSRYGWASTDPTILDVDSLGRVTARAAGTASVVVRFGGLSTTVPVRVRDAGLRFDTLSAGLDQVCGITLERELWCWGGFVSPRLMPRSSSPTQVLPGVRFRAVSASDLHACALTEAGQAMCWGWGSHLGVTAVRGNCASIPCERDPVAVEGGHVYQSVQSFRDGACALTPDGRAHCWGDWPGNGLERSSTPVVVAGASGLVAQAGRVGSRCGLRADGEVLCWTRSAPIRPLDPLLRARSMAGQDLHICAVSAQAHAWCWGANQGGELGRGHIVSDSLPARVLGDTSFAEVYTGWHVDRISGRAHSCGLTEEGAVVCWGVNNRGQLGTGGLDSPSPWGNCSGVPCAPGPVAATVTRERAWRQLALGSGFSCGLATGGGAYCWGWMGGQQALHPVLVPGSVP